MYTIECKYTDFSNDKVAVNKFEDYNSYEEAKEVVNNYVKDAMIDWGWTVKKETKNKVIMVLDKTGPYSYQQQEIITIKKVK